MKVYQWQQLRLPVDSGLFSRMIIFVHVLKDIPIEDVESMRQKELISHFKEVQHLARVSEHESKQINIGIELQLIDFSQLTFGQFIDLETMVSEDWESNFCKIVASIYLHSEGGGLYETKPEPYEHINVAHRAELIEDCEISDVYGAVQKYLKWRQTFFNSYDLFADPFEGVDMDDPENQQIIQEEKKRVENSGNMWMDILNALSDNDITKFESILRLNVYLVFNQLQHLKNRTKSNVPTL